MKTIKKVSITPQFVKFMPDHLEPNILYISEDFKCINHLCLCGCGFETSIHLDSNTGWELIKHNTAQHRESFFKAFSPS